MPVVALPDRGQRLDHRDAAADQQERHEGGQRDAEDRRRQRPVGIAVAKRPVGGEQAAERHRVGGEEDPHAELAPALRGERRLGGLDAAMLGDGGCGAHAQTLLWTGGRCRTSRVIGRAITSPRAGAPRRRCARNSQPAATPNDGVGHRDQEQDAPAEGAADADRPCANAVPHIAQPCAKASGRGGGTTASASDEQREQMRRMVAIASRQYKVHQREEHQPRARRRSTSRWCTSPDRRRGAGGAGRAGPSTASDRQPDDGDRGRAARGSRSGRRRCRRRCRCRASARARRSRSPLDALHGEEERAEERRRSARRRVAVRGRRAPRAAQRAGHRDDAREEHDAC